MQLYQLSQDEHILEASTQMAATFENYLFFVSSYKASLVIQLSTS